MTEAEKQKIAQLGMEKRKAHGMSLRDVSNASNISQTNISFMLSDVEEWRNRTISDEIWDKLAQWAGYAKEGGEWVFTPTKTSNKIMSICQTAQAESIAIGVCGPPGAGKSGSLKQYMHSQPKNTYYLECRPSFSKKIFLQKLMDAIGIATKGLTINGMEEEIINRLSSLKRPLVMLDEIQELPEAAFRVLKTLFNGTEFKCGWVYCGGLNFDKRMKNGLQYCKTSYEEIHSRMGGEVVPVTPPSKKEFEAIIRANRAPAEKVEEIVSHSFSDLRLARRKVMQCLAVAQQ